MINPMPAEEVLTQSNSLSLQERFERVLNHRRAFEAARLELGAEGAVNLFYPNAERDWPNLIPQSVDLSSCVD